jgi:hypothetical protein
VNDVLYITCMFVIILKNKNQKMFISYHDTQKLPVSFEENDGAT